MRVTIITLGTRGDVQPLVALGLGLQQSGHSVTLVTTVDFAAFAAEYGLGFHPFQVNCRALFQSAEGLAAVESGRNILKSIRQFKRLIQPVLKELLDEAWQVSQQAEAVIYAGAATAMPVDHIQETLGIPCYQATLQPLLAPTRCFAHPNFPSAPVFLPPGAWLTHTYNRSTHLLLQQLIWQPLRQTINEWRQERLGQTPLPWHGPYHAYQRQRLPVLHGYSTHLIPRPCDWPAWQHITGYWFLPPPTAWQPPPILVDFLEAGPPPVYIGFGSMSSRRPEQLAEIVLEALAQTGQRGILVSGWGGFQQSHLPDTVLKLEAAPHDWLFPRVSAVVHHGGAGTTAAGVRAGVPSIIVPFFAEQPFWGERIAALGLGPSPIPRQRLTAARLAAAIQTALQDQGMRRRALTLGRLIQAEDGAARAVQVFQDSLLRS